MSDLTCAVLSANQPSHRSQSRLQLLLRVAHLMLSRARERQALASFDDRMLRDIGVTPYEAGVEARKPFWRT